MTAELSLMGATITVMAPGGVEASAAASSAAVQALAEMQFTAGEGPSRESFLLRRPVLVDDLAATTERWVAFTPAALACGVSGVYSFPLSPGAAPLGVLTCYLAAGDRLELAQQRRCLVAADAATLLLLSPEDQQHETPGRVSEATLSGLDIRTEVYQAQGMVTVELGIGLSDAMAVLRAMAYAEGVDLNDLAADLIAGRRDFPGQDREQA